ncbi:MAG: carboxypeptidase-like regulatory domain-containing protein [Bacteroidales bacterium]|nr:carboxypeptidase-like regulatory domain-containing protein [Bacteroidales bacterium]
MIKSDVSLFRRLKLLFLPVLILVFCSFRSPEYYYMGSSLPENGVEVIASILQKQVGGMVVDEEGNPLQGVRVLVSKSTIFSTTDERGRFFISKVPDGSSLIFSCPGYKSYTMLPLIVSNTGIRVRMVKDPEFKKVQEKLPLQKADTGNQVPSPTSISLH